MALEFEEQAAVDHSIEATKFYDEAPSDISANGIVLICETTRLSESEATKKVNTPSLHNPKNCRQFYRWWKTLELMNEWQNMAPKGTHQQSIKFKKNPPIENKFGSGDGW